MPAAAITSLTGLRKAEASCTRCPLYAKATQVVPGEGPARAFMMLVGEQPGDQEDKQGKPFVGPAGRVLDKAIEQAGIARREVFVTNAVKHFKHELRGKRRIHQRPTTAEINACHPWLDAELDAVASSVVVALGATAVRALLGKSLGIAANRGRPLALGARVVLVTYHPSAVLRGDDRSDELRAAIVEDLMSAREAAVERRRSVDVR
jgi:DNA polymerase